jgi:hypothetical protein
MVRTPLFLLSFPSSPLPIQNSVSAHPPPKPNRGLTMRSFSDDEDDVAPAVPPSPPPLAPPPPVASTTSRHAGRTSTSTSRPADRPPRPMNAWLLFRTAQLRQIQEDNPGYAHLLFLVSVSPLTSLPFLQLEEKSRRTFEGALFSLDNVHRILMSPLTSLPTL